MELELAARGAGSPCRRLHRYPAVVRRKDHLHRKQSDFLSITSMLLFHRPLSRLSRNQSPRVFCLRLHGGNQGCAGCPGSQNRVAPHCLDVAAFDVTADGVSALRPVMAAKILSQNDARADLILVSVRSGSYDASPSPGCRRGSSCRLRAG